VNESTLKILVEVFLSAASSSKTCTVSIHDCLSATNLAVSS
jgi:hypothetical protein